MDELQAGTQAAAALRGLLGPIGDDIAEVLRLRTVNVDSELDENVGLELYVFVGFGYVIWASSGLVSPASLRWRSR